MWNSLCTARACFRKFARVTYLQTLYLYYFLLFVLNGYNSSLFIHMFSEKGSGKISYVRLPKNFLKSQVSGTEMKFITTET